ncbi:unnamed protein product [Soboliphyme baturini]|uniref:Septin-type G domain-containing protein n=1 Tax=Soboliphyme baturini TaxID=241478 RepID=A0A183ITL6_9BILA|nr:unnamed protein product [Soboliphyme baturini]
MTKSATSVTAAMTQRREAFFKTEARSTKSQNIVDDATSKRHSSDKEMLTNKVQDENNNYMDSITFLMTRKDTEPANRHRSRRSRGSSVLEVNQYVGFASIVEQVYSKSVRRGFQFTLMVAGDCGMGKSTFVNSLFFGDILNGEYWRKGGEHHQISEQTVVLYENGVRLTLNVVYVNLDHGVVADHQSRFSPVIEHIDRRMLEYFDAETAIDRSSDLCDRRVNCCLYFVPPTGHGLRQGDVEFMKQLHNRVNLIPVIAKADTMTVDECAKMKAEVAREIEQQRIKIYRFPEVSDKDETFAAEQKQYLQRMPFAVIGTSHVEEFDGAKSRCRKYPWGTVQLENLEHNDFVALRSMILRYHMIDLIQVTNDVHYENFRFRHMSLSGEINVQQTEIHPLMLMDRERKEQEKRIKQKLIEMETVFQEKTEERERRLNEKEASCKTNIESVKQAIEKLRKDIEERRKNLRDEQTQLEQSYPEFKRYSSVGTLKEKTKKFLSLS